MISEPTDRREQTIPTEILMDEIKLLKHQVGVLGAEVVRLRRDALTGAERFHLRESQEQIKNLFDDAQKANIPVALMMADMDDFKKAQEGRHMWGDDALAMTAAGIISCLRKTDLLFHHGGDQFVILAPGLGEDKVKEVQTRLEHCMDDVVIKRGTDVGKVSLTVGSAFRESNFDFDGMMKVVDADLLKRKSDKKVGR